MYFLLRYLPKVVQFCFSFDINLKRKNELNYTEIKIISRTPRRAKQLGCFQPREKHLAIGFFYSLLLSL